MIYTLVRKTSADSVDSIISFDSITSMEESWSATVSTQVVERGFNISDNINIEPEVYSIDAIISSYSLFKRENEISWSGESFQSRSIGNYLTHVFARDELLKIFKSGSVLSLIESTANSNSPDYVGKMRELRSGYVNEIDDCVITSLSISHPSAGSGAFYVSLKLQKIHTANVRTGIIRDDVPRALTPRAVKEDGVSSTSSTGGTEVDASVSPVDGTIIEDSASKEPNSSNGLSWDEGFAMHQRTLNKIREEELAIREIEDFAIRHKARCVLVTKSGGGYSSRCVKV